MLKAVIADDEKKICELIMFLGDWERLGIKVIALCGDGEEALACVKNNHPDIVLTDIRMPVFGGLELLSKTRELGLNTAFIVISGHQEFEYAQKALRYGVVDFLVKPIDKTLLNGALKKAAEGIAATRDNDAALQKVSELIEEKKLREKEIFWSNLINASADLTLEQKDLEKTGDIVYQAFMMKTSANELNKENSEFFIRLKAICNDYIHSCEEMALISKSDETFLLLNYKKTNTTVIRQEISAFCAAALRMADIFGAFSLTVGEGLPVYHIGNMTESIKTAKTAWLSRIICVKKDWIAYSSLTFCEVSEKELISDLALQEILKFSQNYNAEKVLQFISETAQKIIGLGMVSPLVIYRVVEKIIYQMTRGLDIDGAYYTQELTTPNSVHELFTALKNLSRKLIEESYENKKALEKLPIRKAKEYMHSHYMDDVTLEGIAGEVGLSPVYFSKLFKESEGVNYIDYLTDLRIGIAKKRLSATNDSIKTIAYDIGYADETYFRKVFKKTTGIKPGEYRKLH